MMSRIAAALFLVLLSNAANADTILGAWQDAGRNRTVPYKIYYDPAARRAEPVVVFSHGLGGNRDAAEYLLSYLSEHGYVAVAIQHPGTDTDALRAGLATDGGAGPGGFDRSKVQDAVRQLADPRLARDRFEDVPFALDQLTAMNANDAKMKGRLEMTRVGMSGHSYGAITSQALMGQRFAMGASFADARIKAAIMYSPSKPRRGDAATAFAEVRIPSFHMTGTEDTSPIAQADMTPQDRLVPYRNIHGPDKYLLVLTGGDHGVFNGRRVRTGPNPKDERWWEIIEKASLAFWDAYLKDKPEAKTYLTRGGFAKDLGADGTYEFEAK